MACLGIVLTRSPLQHQHEETAYGLAMAALDAGHDVHIFCYVDGVYGPMKRQSMQEIPVLPRDHFVALLERGAEIMCCGLCVNARGIDAKTEYPRGVAIKMLPDLADLISDCDRVVAL